MLGHRLVEVRYTIDSSIMKGVKTSTREGKIQLTFRKMLHKRDGNFSSGLTGSHLNEQIFNLFWGVLGRYSMKSSMTKIRDEKLVT